MHEQGEQFLGLPAEETFPGASLPRQAVRIKRLVELKGVRTLLDYGCGKGQQYARKHFEVAGAGLVASMQEYWGVDEIACYDPCYDPCYGPFSTLPGGQFDAVISTDVLEHCPHEDLDWIIEELFARARRFVFANVASYPARKRLPDGQNAHSTVRPLSFWKRLFEAVAARHPELAWEVWIESRLDGRMREDRLGNT